MSKEEKLLKYLQQKQKEIFSGLLLSIKNTSNTTTNISTKIHTKHYGSWEVTTKINKINDKS